MATQQSQPTVLCVGEALIDIVDEPGADAFEVPGGSPANVALTVARLGNDVTLETWLADDDRGRAIARHLAASGVQITPSSWGARRTSTAAAVVDDNGQATYHFDLEWAPPAPLPMSEDTVLVHAGSIAAVLQPGAAAVADLLRRARTSALTTFDPNVRPSVVGNRGTFLRGLESLISLADVIKVSDQDLDWMRGEVPRAAMIRTWLENGAAIVILTCGADGARAWTAGGVDVHVPAAPVEVADTIGAGDSFMGGVIDALVRMGLTGAAARRSLVSLARQDLVKMLSHAAAVADVTVAREGADPPNTESLAESGTSPFIY